MKIIPAIDIYDGKCVRLYKGDYNLKIEYSNTPVDVAKRFESEGAKFLHLVDLEGAKSTEIINHHVVRDLCSQTNLLPTPLPTSCIQEGACSAQKFRKHLRYAEQLL